MSKLVFVVSAAVLLPVAWYGSIYLIVRSGLQSDEARGGAAVAALVLALIVSAVLANAHRFAGNAPAAGWARRMMGWFYRALVVLPLLTLTLWLLLPVYLMVAHAGFPLAGPMAFIAMAAILYAGFRFVVPEVKYRVACLLRPLHDLVRDSQMGAGGSAAFGGVIEDWAARYRPGAVLLGASLYDRSWRVGHDDDRGLLTIASSRSGKGRSTIIPNLIEWPHSALVIDPKGTNAAVTAARRRALGQAVHVVDPFGITPFGDDERARYNPLAMVDFKSIQVTEDIRQIADALVVPDAKGDSHWNEAAQTIIAGLIAHLLASGKGRTLNDVRAVTTQGNVALDALFGDMLEDRCAGGLPAAAAALVTNAGPNERGSFYTTVARNLAWLDSVAMQKALAGTDFDLANLKHKPITVYVVLPPDMLAQHKRFMRLFVNGAINGMSKGGGSGKHKVLFLLDEFYSLGTLAQVEKASGGLSSYGMKLWPIVQNLTQLHDLYPENWETFFANAGAVQVFSVNDNATADYLTRELGKRVVLRSRAGRDVQRTIEALREVEELGRDVSREKRRQIIYRHGADPLVLRRLLYDKDFPATSFAPDPDFAPRRPAAAPGALVPARPSSWMERFYQAHADKYGGPAVVTGETRRGIENVKPAATPDKKPPAIAAAKPPVLLPPPKPKPKPAEAAPPDPAAGKVPKPPDDFMARFQASLKQRPLLPPITLDVPNKPSPPATAKPPVPPAPEQPAKPEGDAGLSFEALIAKPVASSKAAIFERYERLQERAGGDEGLLKRASIWLTGGYRDNLSGPDPFALDLEEKPPPPPPDPNKGNPWAGRRRGDAKGRRGRGE